MRYKALRQLCNKRAMTLIEVVIALALFSMVAVFTVSNTAIGFKLKKKLVDSSDYYHNVRTALRHLDRDISLAYHSYQDTKQGELNRQQKVSTTPTDTNLYTIGTFFKGTKDKLLFSSSSYQRLYKNTNETDTSEVSYYLEPEEKSPGLYDLYKRQSTFIDENIEEGGSKYLIASGIESMNFRYLSTEAKDGDASWVDKWDSTAGDYVGMFPLAVEVTMVFIPPKNAGQKLTVVEKIRILNPNNMTSSTTTTTGGTN